MTVGDTSAEVVSLFDQFVQANTCQSILNVFQQLCDCLNIHPLDDGWFYDTLKSKLTHWKAVSLWNKLDKRFSHKEYNKHKACDNTSVLVIGAGPCGLRSAIECKLLGARVVVIEKRDRFSRNNVLHLWPFVIHDLKSLGAKVFYPKFCAGSIDHISIRQLQCVLMKISLLLGVEIYVNVGYGNLLEPTAPDSTISEPKGWRAQVSPSDHPVSCYEFDVLIGADGKRNTLQGFSRKEFRGKLAIAITVNFINGRSTEEGRVEEISGVAFIFNQKFFKDLSAQTGIDLENIVYYKDDTHYFVMTAKKHSLLEKGVLIQDYRDTVKLLSRDNVNQQALENYAREAADVSTNHKLPNLQFAHNHFGKPDIAMFDFTSLFASDNSGRAYERYGKKLLVNIVGDSLLEPFWPTGSGCARGFLGCFDSAWAVRSWASGCVSPLQVLAERESVYMLLSQTTPESMSKTFSSYTINPITRYKHCNTQALKPIQVRHLYDTTEQINMEDLEPVEIPTKKARTYDVILDYNRLLRWCNKKLAMLPQQVRCTTDNLTTDWKDGTKFYLLLHLYTPDSLPTDHISNMSSLDRLSQAFSLAEKQYSILPMLTPEEILASDEPDKLFMVSYISQYYTTLKDRRTAGASAEFLMPPPNKNKPAHSPSGGNSKMSSLRRFGKMIGTGGRSNKRRKSSAQKSPRGDRTGSTDGELTSPTGPRSPQHLHSPPGTSRRKSKHGTKSPRHNPASPKHTAAVKQGKISAEAFNIFKSSSEEPHKQEEKSVPGTDNVKSRMREIRDAFSLKNKRKSMQPEQKKKAALRENWTAGKYEKLEEYDTRMKQTSWRMERGNIGNTNPGKRGANLVSQVASMFAESTPEPSPVVKRRAAGDPKDESEGSGAAVSGLDVLLNREPNQNEICFFCKKRIYLVERQSAEGKFFHRSCFRCYFCEASLHVGSYTLFRDNLGQARFYCHQHVGKERHSTVKRGLADTVDNSTPCPDSSIYNNPSTSSHQDMAAKYATPERIEFENSMDFAEEEAEEIQTRHNLGVGSPSTDQISWLGCESESESEEEDMDEETAGVDNNNGVHHSNVGESQSTLGSSTVSLSSGEDRSRRDVVPPDTLDLQNTNLSVSPVPSTTNQPVSTKQPVSILKQPIHISSQQQPPAANQKQPSTRTSSNRASAWSQQQKSVRISPNSQNSTVQEINRRKSNFFSQAPEPIRLDVKSVLDPHPSSTSSAANTLTSVNISLGDTLKFKDKTTSSDPPSPVDGEQMETDDVVISDAKNLTEHSQSNVIDTMRRKTPAKSVTLNDSGGQMTTPPQRQYQYENVDIAAGDMLSDKFVTKRKPKTPIHGLDMPDDVPGHEQKEERGRSSESSSSSDTDDTSYTISTPSDNEIDNMPLLGTLRADGTLGPPISRPDASLDIHISADDLTDSSTAAPNYQTSLDSAHDSLSAQSPGDVFVEVPGSSSLCNPPGTGTDEGTPRGTHQGTTQSNRSHRYKPHKINVTKRRGGRYASKGRVAPSSTSTAPKQASITNPTYDHFTFDTEVSGVNVTSNKHKAGNKVKVSQQAICSDDDESNIYETVGRPTAATGDYHALEDPREVALAEEKTPLRKKLTLDASLTRLSFDESGESSTCSEDEPDSVPELRKIAHDVIPSRPVSNIELDGSFHKMCLTEAEPTLASDEPIQSNLDYDDDDLFVTEEELSSSEESDDDSDSSESSPDGQEGATGYQLSPTGGRKLTPEKIQSAAARQHKREEMKRLRIAQEIQRQLQEVEVKTKALENEGVELEKSLRSHVEPNSQFKGDQNKELMERWFNVIHCKSQLFRYESELMVRAKELELEDRHARLTTALREKMLRPESDKSHDESTEEKKILNELLEVVEQRDELVQMLETERLKEREEDEQLQNVMTRKGFQLSPVPYTQVTLKKAYNPAGGGRRLLST